jgi:putative phosphoribosyl transferase
MGMERQSSSEGAERLVQIPVGLETLAATLSAPKAAPGIVLFAHGSGSSRHSPRNRAVARVLQDAGLATLLLDLLTPEEEMVDQQTGRPRFDINLLSGRLIAVTDWLQQEQAQRRFGYFGASTGAAAALVAAAERPQTVAAVVSRGGRPDLAGAALAKVRCPTLLIVGGADYQVIELNQQALTKLPATSALESVPGATHLFEEPGALETVARLARDWFQRYLRPSVGSPVRADGGGSSCRVPEASVGGLA